MHIPKKYLHDRMVLLLVSVNIFLACLCIVLTLLRGGIGQDIDSYIVQYRENLGISAYQRGDIIPILSFMFFAVVTLVIHVLLSIKAYALRRALALTILALGALILLLTIIVSNALLAIY